MNLEEWDHAVGFNLKMVREHTDACSYFINRLTARPDFETLALDDLRRLKKELASALETVMKAEVSYHAKPKTGIGA
jgi:hypothetical protein